MADQHPPGCPAPDYDGEDGAQFREHVITDLHHLSAMVAALVDELETFRPVLRMFRPGNGVSDLTRAGVARAMRKRARDEH